MPALRRAPVAATGRVEQRGTVLQLAGPQLDLAPPLEPFLPEALRELRPLRERLPDPLQLERHVARQPLASLEKEGRAHPAVEQLLEPQLLAP